MGKNKLMPQKKILITNDDGINAPALDILKESISELGNITIVAPSSPQSATGSSLTLHKPVRLSRVSSGKFSVSGTPADCVRVGILKVLEEEVDLVISGINSGANLGDDVGYSGTVAAAREASLLGVPAIASSLVIENGCVGVNYSQAAEITLKVAKLMVKEKMAERKILNLNIPDLPDGEVKGIKACRLGRRVYDRKVRERVDPAGRKYYWIVGSRIDGVKEQGTDFEAIARDYASLTPLKLDYTDSEMKKYIEKWDLN